ncbi:hypothetical protein [Ensifer sesbaniae]|uniref:hypothetical protein n=1 Tax=Ensifer sesbaniae TaxID=1214071 RepID=UPI00156818A8|nr:hypothetical protein [Ensifer sesbaniae]
MIDKLHKSLSFGSPLRKEPKKHARDAAGDDLPFALKRRNGPVREEQDAEPSAIDDQSAGSRDARSVIGCFACGCVRSISE